MDNELNYLRRQLTVNLYIIQALKRFLIWNSQAEQHVHTHPLTFYLFLFVLSQLYKLSLMDVARRAQNIKRTLIPTMCGNGAM